MTDWNEKIAAFLDGQMSEDEARAFEDAVEQDPALAEEVARLADNDQLLRAAFDAPMHEPVDDTLLARMGLNQPAVETVVAFPTNKAANDNPSVWRKWQWPMGGAIAASLALMLVIQIGQGPVQRDALSVALDTTPSSATVRLADGKAITPQISFAAKDGRFCREFLQTSAGKNETGIACRSKDGWSVEALTKGGAVLPGSKDIMTASGEDPSKLDAAYQRLGASDPFDAVKERALIDRRWAASPSSE
jgi:hypothetical protein